MNESKEVSTAYGVPKWMKKKAIRYEVEDFIVSPPNEERGSHFQLRYGRSNSRQSTYGKISSQNDDLENEGLGTLGVKGPDSIGHRERKESIGGTISISSGGFEFDQTPEDQPTSTLTFEIGSGPKVDPLFVLPWKKPYSKLKEHEVDSSSTQINSNIQDLSTAVQHCQINQKEVYAESTINPSFEVSVNKERRRNRSGQRLLDLVIPLTHYAKPNNKSSLSSQDDDSSDELSNRSTPPHCVTPFTTPVDTPQVTPGVTPGVTPVVTPAGSPTRQRKVQKISGVVMDPSATSMAISSYFFTKPFKSPQDQVDSLKRTEQLMEVTKIEGSESKPKMGKPCKPKAKPTALREMNFWAPTSM